MEATRWLVERGADVNAKAHNGRTILHAAAWNGHIPSMELLVENGADVEAVDQQVRNRNCSYNYNSYSCKSTKLFEHRSGDYATARHVKPGVGTSTCMAAGQRARHAAESRQPGLEPTYPLRRPRS